ARAGREWTRGSSASGCASASDSIAHFYVAHPIQFGVMRFSRRSFLAAAGAASLAHPAAPAPALRLWYRQPAPDWNEALPIGAGRLGAMIFGGVAEERLQLNENTLYSDEPGRRDLPLDIMPKFDRVIGLLRSGEYAEAAEIISRNWCG